MAIQIPPRGDSFRKAGAHFANLEVTAQDTPDLTVKSTAGGFWNDEATYVEHAGGTSPVLTAPGANARLTVISLNLSGALVLIVGDIAASPDLPTIPSDRMPLAVVLMNSTDTVIDPSMVFDLRPVFNIGGDINNLTVAEIVGLASQLTLKADGTALTNGLALKADTAGTACSIFSLNANHTGAPTADASFRVERGAESDVEIRWNETSEVWEFTNDGTDFQSISSASNQGSQITALQASVVAIDASLVNINASLVNINASLVDLHASVDQNSSVIGVLVAASTHPVNLTAFRAGTLTDDTVFWIWPVGVSTTIPTQSALGTALAATPGDGSATNITLKHSASVGAVGSIIGNVKFPAAASSEGTVDVSTLAVVAPGEYLWASVAQITDAVIADIAFTITATKTTT